MQFQRVAVVLMSLHKELTINSNINTGLGHGLDGEHWLDTHKTEGSTRFVSKKLQRDLKHCNFFGLIRSKYPS
jgi:hypothetical protein